MQRKSDLLPQQTKISLSCLRWKTDLPAQFATITICEKCGGGSICQHQKVRLKCRSCHGGSFCEHKKVRYFCRTCDGSYFYKHLKQKNRCADCDPLGYLATIVCNRVYADSKSDKEMSSTEYLGCNIETFKKHIEQQFKEGISRENYGEWHIDQKIPLKYNKPSLEEVAQRLHYTNTQSMWAGGNMSKGCRYISD